MEAPKKDDHSDPSLLTTQQLWREISALKELLESKIEGLETAIKVAHEDLVRVPTEVQKQVGSLKELHDEKFKGIEERFKERDSRTQVVAELNQKAIDAALQAAKEIVGVQTQASNDAIAKSEAATTKQIDAQGILINATEKTLDDKIGAVKETVTIIESRTTGGNAVWAWLFGAAGAAIGIVAIIISVVK
jgi:hypothetical protein